MTETPLADASVPEVASSAQAAFDAVRAALETAVLSGSPLQRAARGWMTDHPLPPGLLIPVAAAGGVGPAPVSVAAALGFQLLAMRWLDDLIDRDREGQLWQQVGEGGAAVLSASALCHGWACLARAPEVPRDLLVEFGEMTAVLALGEEADVNAPPDSLAGWQAIAWRKTAVCYRFAALAGARLSGAAAWQRQAAEFGTHLGLWLQAMDDIEGCFSDDAPDLCRGATMTLPLVLLAADLPETAALFRARDVGRLRREMARRDLRAACRAQAEAYRARAAAALVRCPGPWTEACDGLLPALCGIGGDGPAMAATG